MSILLDYLSATHWLMPHGQCYLWNPVLVSLHALSDSLITLAYYSIPLTLTSLIRQRRDLPFTQIFWLFAAFIVACGTTHALEVLTIWYPAYWVSGVFKGLTAVVSLYTAFTLIPLMPQIMTLPSPSQLASVNQELESKVQECQIAEFELHGLNKELEARVEQRTLDLQCANDNLMQYARQQQFIAQLGQQALSGVPFQELMAVAIKGVIAILKVDYGYILEVINGHQVRMVTASANTAELDPVSIDSNTLSSPVISTNQDQQSEINYLLSTQQPLIISDLSQESRFCQSSLLQSFPVTSGIGVQILGHPLPYGLMCIWAEAHRQFAPDQVDFLEAVAVILATAVEQQQIKTALRRNEDRLRLALDNSPIAMFTQDKDLRYTWIYNPQQGIDAQEWIGKTDWDLLGSSNADVIDLKQQVFQTGSSLRQKVTLTLNGNVAVYDMSLEPLQEGEQTIGLIGVAVNITELQAVERLKDEFLSMVSHELRTPLSSLHGSLTLLATGRLGELDAKGQRLLEIAARNTERLSRLVSDILDLERLESGKIKIKRKLCNAAELINQAIATMKSMADEAEVHLSSRALQIEFSADPDRILQVLTNLLSNAIKFSVKGQSVIVEVKYEWDTLVLFQVSDTGRGIPKDKLETIFEQFQQVDASDSRLKGGTGLGLPICRSIVRQHGGTIWAKSEVGKGSTFYFSIPLDPDAEG